MKLRLLVAQDRRNIYIYTHVAIDWCLLCPVLRATRQEDDPDRSHVPMFPGNGHLAGHQRSGNGNGHNQHSNSLLNSPLNAHSPLDSHLSITHVEMSNLESSPMLKQVNPCGLFFSSVYTGIELNFVFPLCVVYVCHSFYHSDTDKFDDSHISSHNLND